MELISKDGIAYADSREIAEMVDKRHADLCRDIERYINVLGQNAKLRSDDFFIESTYKAGTGKNYKYYLLTKKGCDMVANKMTGEKGILFTATYIDKFYEMEQKLKSKKRTSRTNLELQKERLAIQKAKLWIELANSAAGTYSSVCRDYAANTLAGKELFPLYESTERTYSATEVGEILGISAVQVGKLANIHNVKIPKYGRWHHDSAKDIDTFRYNANGINMIRLVATAKRNTDGTIETEADMPSKDGTFIECLKITVTPKKENVDNTTK